MATDPVCGMTLDEKKAAAKADHQGTTYYFCSAHCQHAFSAEPTKYATAGSDSMPRRGEGDTRHHG